MFEADDSVDTRSVSQDEVSVTLLAIASSPRKRFPVSYSVSLKSGTL